MMRVDLLPRFTVKVEGGSGCLFQPIDDTYCYVLTAKHVILDNENPVIVRQFINDQEELINDLLEIIGTPFLHSDDKKDAAIIKVEKKDGFDDLLRGDLLSENKDNYYLCGHPNSRQGDAYSFRENKLTIGNKKQYGYREAELSRVATHGEVVGQSGGGIIKIEDSCFLLAGIQKKMAVADSKETLGRIEFMPLSFFDEIINDNKGELSLLFPPYIGSFERLINDIFPLHNLVVKKNLIQNELKNIARGLCNDFSPIAILNLFNDEFLINGTEKSINNHKQLWCSFLELLTYNQLHSEAKLTLNDLNELHKKRKLFIVDTDRWTKKINEIYSSDLSAIELGGSIVICSTNERETNKLEFSKEELKLIIPDISNPIDPNNISQTVKNPFEDLKLVNIFKFQDAIINNILKYQEMNVLNSKETIKSNTDGIL